jgi:hypothetical protein
MFFLTKLSTLQYPYSRLKGFKAKVAVTGLRYITLSRQSKANVDRPAGSLTKRRHPCRCLVARLLQQSLIPRPHMWSPYYYCLPFKTWLRGSGCYFAHSAREFSGMWPSGVKLRCPCWGWCTVQACKNQHRSLAPHYYGQRQ